MFRQTPGVDLNDFPALGTPTNRSSTQASNRVAASYASTAGTALMQDPSLLGNNNDLSDYNLPMGALYPMQNNNAQQSDLARRAVGPRGFSMDDFPALRSSSSAFAPPKQEAWSGYAARDATPTELNGVLI
ncbi:hypothetical protein K501DRAFT_204539 [Backusella circina FSU 941]|nr:hypothetical protein K501DRAFT_204539 [Backusella circina FSU 941]